MPYASKTEAGRPVSKVHYNLGNHPWSMIVDSSVWILQDLSIKNMGGGSEKRGP